MSPQIQALYFGLNKYLINPIIIILFAVAALVFVWGLVEFIARKDSEDAQKAGRQHMLWGIIGLAIMVGAVGIKAIIISIIGSVS